MDEQRGMPWAPPPPKPIDETAVLKVSSLSKRTAIQHARLDRGRHPLFNTPVKPGTSCGTCAHFRVHRFTKAFFKCGLAIEGGPATDIRKSWHGCQRWEERSEGT